MQSMRKFKNLAAENLPVEKLISFRPFSFPSPVSQMKVSYFSLFFMSETIKQLNSNEIKREIEKQEMNMNKYKFCMISLPMITTYQMG